MESESVGKFYISATLVQRTNSKKRGLNATAHHELIAVRQALYKNLNKTQEMKLLLDKSDVQCQTIGKRLPCLEKEMAPLLVKVESAQGVSEWIEKILGPAKLLIHKFDEAHLLEKALTREPREDLEAYMSAVTKLADLLDYLKQNSGVVIKLLEEAMQFLVQAKSADKYRVMKINESLMAHKAHQADEKARWWLDGGLQGVAHEKLVKEFKRLMVDHTIPLTLPERIDETATAPGTGRTSPGAMTTAGDDEQVDDATLLPVWVLERLHAIMETLEYASDLQGLMSAFVEIRSTETFVSLQALRQLQSLGLSQPLKLDYFENWSPEAIESIDWDELQTMIALWCQHIEVAVKVLYTSERKLVRQVLGHLSDQDSWEICFLRVASTGMIQFLQFGEGVACSQRAPEKLSTLLDMFEALEKCVTTIDTVFEYKGPGLELRTRTEELQKLVVSGACKTFWEFKELVAEPNKGALIQDGSVMQLTRYVVNYLKYLVTFYSPILDKLLKIDKNWQFEGEEEQGGLPHSVLLFMQAVELQVEQCSEEFSDPALRHLFIMNNLCYMCNRVGKCQHLGLMLGETWLNQQQQKVQQHSLAYELEVCGHMLHQLNLEEGKMAMASVGSGRGSSSTRELMRKRLQGFTTALEEVYTRQAHWSVPEDDLREQTIQALVDTVVPAYESFLEIYGHTIDSPGAAGPKGVKYLPNEVERMLKCLLMGSQTNLLHHSNNGSRHGGSAYALPPT